MKPINARGLLVAAVLSVAFAGGSAAATAAPVDDGSDLYVRRRPPTVPTDPGRVRVASETDTRVLGTTLSRTAGSQPMPITGGDVAGLTAIGLGAVGIGTVLVRRGRRTA